MEKHAYNAITMSSILFYVLHPSLSDKSTEHLTTKCFQSLRTLDLLEEKFALSPLLSFLLLSYYHF